MAGSEIPIWPTETNPRRMTFLFGEARWYLWMQEENKQAILSLQRDLLMLHQNGDLELFRERNVPAVGTYITALHEGRMIRGRVYSPDKRSINLGSTIHVIDIDEGKLLELSKSQVRRLPLDMTSLPCQAVRCDIGLNCIELFHWPPQLNDMLHKALRGALFFVEYVANRPGSIPTISAKVTICHPSTGQSIDMQKWLLQIFSPRLDFFSFENYKPFPVGMEANLMANNMEFLQQQMLGFTLQGYPPGLPLPAQFGMLPPPALMPYPNQMLPYPSPMLLSPNQMLPPQNQLLSVSNAFLQSPMLSTDSSNSASWRSSFTTPIPPTPPPPLPPQSLSTGLSSFVREMSSSNSSLSSAGLNSAALYESDFSRGSNSTVGIDLDVNLLESTSSTSENSKAPLVPIQSPRKEKLVDSHVSSHDYQPSVSCGRGHKRNSKTQFPSSSSSLSADAAPFVRGRDHEKTETLGKTLSCNSDAQPFVINRDSKNEILSSSSSLSVEAPTFIPTKSTLKKKNENFTGNGMKESSGKDVEVVQVIRDWKVGCIVPVMMARVWNPSCFEVNVIDEHCESLPRMQEEMNEYYALNRITLSSKQQAKELCGDFCACYDADEKIWFRAVVHEWFMDDSVTPLRVWAVDYGGYSQQDMGCIQPLTTELACSAPILVTICSMKNIQPRYEDTIWPEIHLHRVKELLPVDKQLYLRIDGPKSEEDIWPVSVFTDPNCSLESINEILVAEGCASYVESSPVKPIAHPPSPSVPQSYEDSEDPMEAAYNVGRDNYDYDDEDACVAVSGRKPTDEIGICWFYQRNGYCYKKYCDLKHIRLDPDGYTQEKSELHRDAFEDISESVLAPGKCVKVAVSRILTVHHFIAKLCISKGTAGVQSRETLASVLRNLNSTEMKRSLHAFTEYPADGEIVLAKDKDGIFYRGRIISSDSEDDTLFEVLNVDTGLLNWVPLQNLRRVDPAFLHHPFQAIECWLADVAPVQCDREWVKTCNTIFADIVKGQKLKATVVRSGPWGIEVNLFDKDGQDIAVILKEMGIVKNCPMRHLPDCNAHKLPG